MDRITLGDDPWSERVRARIRESPHQATLKLWADGKPPTEYDTPYVRYLRATRGLGVSKSRLRQDRFWTLFRDAPVWPPERELFLDTDGCWRGPIAFRVRAGGEIGCDDGFHRLNILHHRGDPLTGVVVERDPEWSGLRDTVRAKIDSGTWRGQTYEGRGKRQLYHPIPHPDFQMAHVRHPSPPPLAGFVKQHGIGTALDLGTHFGWALYSLRHHLQGGTGVESDPLAYAVARLVLERIGMRAVRADITEHLRVSAPVDLVLALNVLHHVPLDEVLALIRAKFVAVSLPNPSEAVSQKLPPDPYEYVRRKLRASVVWEAPFEGRRLQLLRVDS